LKIKEYTNYYKSKLKDALDTLSKESRINLSTVGIETETLFYSITTFNPNWDNFIILEEKRIVAFSRLKKTGKSFEIQGFFVPEDLQRKGYGSKLMIFLIGYSFGAGAKRISLEVRKSNQKAISFYKKFSFKKKRRKDPELNWMELKL